MSNLPGVKLPRERLEQLRQLVQNVPNATISEAIGAVLKMAREQGRIDIGIPGVEFHALSDGIAIRIDSGEFAGFSFDEAERIANEIRKFVAGERENAGTIILCDTHESTFMVKGKGRGVAISIPANAAPKVLTHDLARELADVIEHEIAKATRA